MKTFAFLSLTCLTLVSTGCETYYWAHHPNAVPPPVGLNAEDPGIMDDMFVHDALKMGAHGIEMGRLAMERGENPDLKLLGQRVYDDHARANKELALIAARDHVAVPSLAERASGLEELGPVPTENFDRWFISHVLQEHRSDIKMFEMAARMARSTEIREFAGRTLPALQEHVRIAENINKIAALNADINEPAGAELPGAERDPYLGGDEKVPHQFNEATPQYPPPSQYQTAPQYESPPQ